MRITRGDTINGNSLFIIPKLDHIDDRTAVFVGLCGIMAAGCVDVAVSQNIRNQVNIAGLLIQIGAKGGSQLVRTDLFERRNDGGILFYQIFNAADIDSFTLKR